METLDGVERELTPDDLSDLRRQARRAGNRRRDGRRVGRGLRPAPPRSCSSRRTSRRRGSRRPRSGSACARRRARFERGVDPNDVAAGAARAMELLGRGCRRAAELRRHRRVPRADRAARDAVRTDRVNRLLATSLSDSMSPSCSAARHRGRRRDRDRAHLAPRHRARDRPRRGGRAPHRARPDRARCRRIPRRSAGSPPTSASGAVADVLVGAGYDEVYTLPLLAPADLARAGVPTDALIEVENPLRRGVDPAARAAAGCAARGRAQRRARQSRRRRSSSSGASSRPPRPDRRCRSSDCTSRSPAPAKSCSRPTSPTARSPSTT